MEAINVIAVSKAISDKAKAYVEAREALDVGEYTVDVTVRVTGAVKVGADYEQVCAPAADPWGLLAVALSKLNGVTVDAIVAEHLNADADQISAIKEQADAAIKAIKAPTKKGCKGKVTTKLQVAEVVPVA